MGAGIGGLSTAHKLAKKGYEVHIFERNSEVGGQARSRFTSDGEHSEYCWHMFVQGYISLIPLLQEVPFNGKTVASQLKPMKKAAYGRTGNRFWVDDGESFLGNASLLMLSRAMKEMDYKYTLRDVMKMAMLKSFIFGSVPERFDRYDGVYWKDLMCSLSPDMKKNLLDGIGMYLGMDPTHCNAHTMLHMFRPTSGVYIPNLDDEYLKEKGYLPQYYSMNGPMSEHMFEPWVKFIEERGASLFLNTKIKEICFEGGKVQKVIVEDLEGEKHLRYDYYVNSLDVTGFAEALSGVDELKEKMLKLSKLSFMVQPQVTFHLKEKIDFGGALFIVFPDSPWAIMCRPEGSVWDVPLSKTQPPTGEVIAMGIGVWDRKGILYNKTARECTREELRDEAWAQMKQCKGLLQHFKTTNGLTYDDIQYSSYSIWHSFSFDETSGTLETWEPKFSNNVGTFALRPPTWQKEYSNLVNATAYTVTDVNLFNMDSAAEAGTRAANYITCGKPEPDLAKYISPGKFWNVCQQVDRRLFKMGFPNVFELLLNKI